VQILLSYHTACGLRNKTRPEQRGAGAADHALGGRRARWGAWAEAGLRGAARQLLGRGCLRRVVDGRAAEGLVLDAQRRGRVRDGGVAAAVPVRVLLDGRHAVVVGVDDRVGDLRWSVARFARRQSVSRSHAHVAVDDVVDVKVVGVQAQRADEHLGHLEPAQVEGELEQREEGHVEVDLALARRALALARGRVHVQVLAPKQRAQHEHVDRERGHLRVHHRDLDPVVAEQHPALLAQVVHALNASSQHAKGR